MKWMRHNRNRLFKRLSLVVVFLIAVLTIVFRGFVFDFFRPIGSGLSQAGTWIATVVTKSSVPPDEYESLLQRLEILQEEAKDVELLKRENEELQELLGFVDRTSESYVPARILSKHLSDTSVLLLLDIGLNDGVQIGSAVVAESGVLLGKIIDATSQTATVEGVTSQDSAVAVSVLNDHRTIGVAHGIIGDLLEVEFIPVDESLEENDLVVTSGLEESVPSGILVGIVNAVNLEQGVPFQTAILEPLVDVRHVSHVLVLTDPYVIIQ